MKLEDLKAGSNVAGISPDGHAHVVAVTPVGENTVTVVYKSADGRLAERMLFREDEAKLSAATAGRIWSFDADGADFKLAAEALRIELAHLFDPMMAVHTSNVEPLPHQISAVYEAMLPRQPLRFVLADDPGAGKTIMAGLLMRELIMRADAARILRAKGLTTNGRGQVAATTTATAAFSATTVKVYVHVITDGTNRIKLAVTRDEAPLQGA